MTLKISTVLYSFSAGKESTAEENSLNCVDQNIYLILTSDQS